MVGRVVWGWEDVFCLNDYIQDGSKDGQGFTY